MHANKRKTFAASLMTCAIAVTASIVIAPQPAQAGMGTGSPPPPPPPPLIVKQRMFETSDDSDLRGLGYSGQVVLHQPRDINTGGTSVITVGDGATGGRFTYTVYEGQTPRHRGYLFGCESPGFVTGDININTDATLLFEIPNDESNADFTKIANPTNDVIKRWEFAYEVERNKETKVTRSGPDVVNYNTRSLTRAFLPRNASARPGDIDKKPITFQLKKLEGYDGNGTLRLKWIDDPANGRVTMVPQETKTLQIRKVASVVQK